MDKSTEILEKFNQTKLSNQAIAALSRLANLLRGRRGLIKVSDVVSNHRYAFNFFVQAVLSGKDEVVVLTRQVNNEMNIEKPLIDALDTYFTQIKLEERYTEVIQKNQYFLTKLANFLYGVKVENVSYRQAVNQLLLDVGKYEKKFCVALARSFYPYWLNASNAFMDSSDENFSKDMANRESIIDTWKCIDEVSLSPLANEQLRRYADAMKTISISSKEIDVRKKIAKVILFESVKYDQTADGYRATTDAIKSRFTSVRLKDYVLSVSRDFYRFWSDTQASA